MKKMANVKKIRVARPAFRATPTGMVARGNVPVRNGRAPAGTMLPANPAIAAAAMGAATVARANAAIQRRPAGVPMMRAPFQAEDRYPGDNDIARFLQGIDGDMGGITDFLNGSTLGVPNTVLAVGGLALVGVGTYMLLKKRRPLSGLKRRRRRSRR